MRPLASIHGKSGFIDENGEDSDDSVDLGNQQRNNQSNGRRVSIVPPVALPSTQPHVASGASTDSESFIANMMAQGYKRDEAFLMYLRKVNAEKALLKQGGASVSSAIMVRTISQFFLLLLD